RSGSTVDRAVRHVHGSVSHDDTGAGCDDVAVRDVELAAAAHRDRIAVDENLATVEMDHALAFANDRLDRITVRRAFVARTHAARADDADARPRDAHLSAAALDRVACRGIR